MPLLKVEQRSPEWHEARRGRITASVAAAILGVGPKGQLWAYNQINGEPEVEEGSSNWYMKWGIQHEQAAREEYEVQTGRVVLPTGFWVHDREPWLGASPDGLVGQDGLWEGKCPQQLPEKLPPDHEIQCRIQMACTGRSWTDYFVWTQGGSKLFSRIERDLDKERELIMKLHAWFKAYILTNTAPPRRRTA